MRKAYQETVGAFVKEAEANGEVPEVAWAGIVDELLWCHYVGVMMYWLKDDSENHEDTSQFIDRTVNLFAAVVGGPLLRQAEELVGFLVNRHLMPLLMNLGSLGRSRAGYGAAGPRGAEAGSAKESKESKESRQAKASKEAKRSSGPASKSSSKPASKPAAKTGSARRGRA
jgi:hypothetical protein